MRTKFNIQHLLSPSFSKNIEENSQEVPPPSLPVNIFEINVEEYLTKNVMDVPAPFKPLDDNMLNAKLMRQALGIKVNNSGNYQSSSTSSNYRTSSTYQSSNESYKKTISSNGTSTTKFGFSKH